MQGPSYVVRGKPGNSWAYPYLEKLKVWMPQLDSGACFRILVLQFISCVIFGKSLNLSVPSDSFLLLGLDIKEYMNKTGRDKQDVCIMIRQYL